MQPEYHWLRSPMARHWYDFGPEIMPPQDPIGLRLLRLLKLTVRRMPLYRVAVRAQRGADLSGNGIEVCLFGLYHGEPIFKDPAPLWVVGWA